MFFKSKKDDELQHLKSVLNESNEALSVFRCENERLEKELKDERLKRKVAEMYANDDEALIELLELAKMVEKKEDNLFHVKQQERGQIAFGSNNFYRPLLDAVELQEQGATRGNLYSGNHASALSGLGQRLPYLLQQL